MKYASLTFMNLPPRSRATTPAAATAVAIFVLAAASPAHAEKADREKPIRYSANTLDGNEADQTVLLSGKVEVTQGTIVLKADRVVLKQQPDGTYNVTATGKPVTFRQKMDNSDEYVDAQALRVEYLGSKDLVELYDQSWIRRGKDELRGNFLTYNSATGAFAGRGTWPLSGPSAQGGDGRISGVIQPKPKEPAKEDTKPAEGAKLQPAPTLGTPPKE
jgi:lipopolysaccharide export system protein LptA